MNRARYYIKLFLLLSRALTDHVILYISANKRQVAAFMGALLVVIFLYNVFIAAPQTFPLGSIVTIPEGVTLSETSALLHSEHVIRSPFLFSALAYISFNQKNIFAGDYLLPQRANIFSIIDRLTRGVFGLSSLRITIPEGLTIREMADVFSRTLSSFDKEKFITYAHAEDAEGYLFPDTYFFLPNTTETQVYETLRTNFDRKISDIRADIDASPHSLKDIVIMASLLEKEARQYETKQMIAGILWKRLEMGMPLQVDATFLYINGKNTYELSLDDLAVDSPYNTYKYGGLPKGPITNPGLDSIRAALNPISNDYLYYLSDRDGNMYYSMTFDEHKRHKALHVN